MRKADPTNDSKRRDISAPLFDAGRRGSGSRARRVIFHGGNGRLRPAEAEDLHQRLAELLTSHLGRSLSSTGCERVAERDG
jgi:hypothetical protein